MKRRTALWIGVGLLLTAGVVALPYAMWRLVSWLLYDPKGDD